MKRKRLVTILGCILAVAMLAGIAIPLVVANETTVEFVNPLGRVIPPTNQPLTARLDSISGQNIRLLMHGAANSASQLTMTALRNTLVDAGAVVATPTAFGGTAFDARTEAQYENWASGTSAVVIGVLEENVAAWWVGYHAKEIEKWEVPVVVVTTEWFSSGVIAGAQDNGFANMRVVIIPNEPWADAQGYAASAAGRGAYVRDSIVGGDVNIGAAVITALTGALTADELSPAPLSLAAMGIPNADGQPLSVAGADEVAAMSAFYDLSMSQGFSFGDGLPLAIPIQPAVDDLIAASGRPADEIIGRMMLRGGLITVETVAANAVMAGAAPRHFPAILAAVEAYANSWEDNKIFYRSMMSHDQRQIVLAISGPIVGTDTKAGQLDVSRGRTLGLGSNDSAVIGRAFMLSIRNIGHIAFENSNAMSAYSRIYSHETLVFGEENLYLPNGWVTMSEQMGFGEGANTVTIISTTLARIQGGVGGTAAGGTAGALFSPHAHRVQSRTGNANNTPRIHIVHWRDSHQLSSTNTAPALEGGWGRTALGLTSKDLLQRWIAADSLPTATTGEAADTNGIPAVGGSSQDAQAALVRNEGRENLVWTIVAGFGHSTQGRVLHGASADYNNSRGFHTQRIGGTPAPSAPQNAAISDGDLTWTAPTRGTVTSFEVSLDGGRTWTDVGNVTTYDVSESDVEDFIVVRARNDNSIEANKNSFDIRSNATGNANATRDWSSSGRGAWAVVD